MKQQIGQTWDKWTRLTPPNALYDRTLLWLYFGFLCFGLVAVTSASIPVSTRLTGNAFYFAQKDLISILLSLVLFFVCVQLPINQWEKYHAHLYLLAFVGLILVLFIGKSVYGAKRWISIAGFTFQPAEFAKFALSCYLASFFVRKYDEMRQRPASCLRPLALLFILGFLLLLQPDLGSAVVLLIITVGMFFIVGAKLKQFIFLGIVAVLGVGALIFFEEYRLKRFLSFSNPFADIQNTGYQLAHSQMAFGRGEWFGEGLGNSIQKLDFLPEAHTDFVMSVVGEEFGFFGICLVIFMLGALIFRAFKIGKESLLQEERFKGFWAMGIGIWIFLQGFVNLGVAIGLLPTKGLTFPLVSYGGSSLIIMSVAIAVLMRIDYENRLERGQAHPREE
ncbi:putative lipid II flippase FtsW [Mergibacter septicus]|uniref:Probable peptidoglycan glycosyltransferase FtsW n=1 Tax=Mergibacter septicus TaxID=221402 RepID=A0A8E3MFA5_9PAST|nr:putative lipid II flippase FtsW [Mergibacter septicus]AWX14994.1 putative lipid II flippase FtsW [Mergibacter septicus]QDJ14246.1 putative lipid II flippase FtsW [Mergibacter septicus]UTU48309.1 putative lipid II flippase FtsW [Mergibacter septicus]WMR96068.1 putative lipid II flippase FtsW [Mergibacter septicus]